MRTVHLIETDAANPLTLRLLGDLLAAGQCRGAVRVIGPRRVVRAAEQAELPIDRAIITSGTRFGDGRAMRAAGREFDAAHTWSLRGATLAGLACGGVKQQLTLTAPPQPSPGPIARMLLRRGGLDPQAPHVIAPIIDPGRIVCETRSAMRMQLGAGDHMTRLAMLVGDAPDVMDVLRAVLAAGLVDETGRPLRVVISPDCPGLRRAMRTVDAEQRGQRVILTHQADEPWKIVGACDLAIAVGGGLSTAWAMAAGLPIAAQDHASVTALLTHEHNALLAPVNSAGELARRIRRIIDEPDTATTLGRAAAELARTRLHPGKARLAG